MWMVQVRRWTGSLKGEKKGKVNSESDVCNMTRFSLSAQRTSSLQLLWSQKFSTAVYSGDLCLHGLIDRP